MDATSRRDRALASDDCLDERQENSDDNRCLERFTEDLEGSVMLGAVEREKKVLTMKKMGI